MKQKIMFLLIIISAIVASLGTYPYAKDFSHSLFNNHTLSLFIAGIFVPAAVSANIALGVYSLNDTLVQSRKENGLRTLLIIAICLLAALSNGFMCFVGYYDRLNVFTNILLSLAVVSVNTGIGFSAINNALNDLTHLTKPNSGKKIKRAFKQDPAKQFLSLVVMLSALLVTLTAYLASTHGLSMLLEQTSLSVDMIKKISYITAIVIWLPGAALFANGSRITLLKLYEGFKSKRLKFSYVSMGIILIAIASGSAYAQMALEFFNTSKFIPNIFKDLASHVNFVFYVIMPLAFIISGTVNAYALENLRKETAKNYGKLFQR